MDILLNFSENLSELIDDQNLTVEEFAQTVDIAFSEVYKYLNKTYLPKLSNVIKIADRYNYSIDYLLGFIAFPENASFKTTPPFNQRFKALLKEKGLTRYKLHTDAKISINCLDSWYNGKHIPSLDNAIKLKKHFDCTIDYLLGRE